MSKRKKVEVGSLICLYKEGWGWRVAFVLKENGDDMYDVAVCNFGKSRSKDVPAQQTWPIVDFILLAGRKAVEDYRKRGMNWQEMVVFQMPRICETLSKIRRVVFAI